MVGGVLLLIWFGQRFNTQMFIFLILAAIVAVLAFFAWRAGR